jgi:catalase
VPALDNIYYNNNKTAYLSIFNNSLPTVQGLNIGILVSVYSNQSITQASSLNKEFADLGLFVSIVAEYLAPGVNLTYSAADAIVFNSIIITSGSESIFINRTSPLYPLNRLLQILETGFAFGKPVGTIGSGSTVFQIAGIQETPGVYLTNSTATLLSDFEAGLKKFIFGSLPVGPACCKLNRVLII